MKIEGKKGYTFTEFAKGAVKNENFESMFEDMEYPTETASRIREVVLAGGKVFAMKLAKKVILAYVFEKTGSDKEKNLTLTHTDTFAVDSEATNAVIAKMDASIDPHLPEFVVYHGYNEVIFKGVKYEKKMYSKAGFSASGSLLGFACGLCIGMCFGQWWMAICFGICFAMLWGTTMTPINTIKPDNPEAANDAADTTDTSADDIE